MVPEVEVVPKVRVVPKMEVVPKEGKFSRTQTSQETKHVKLNPLYDHAAARLVKSQQNSN